MLALAEHSRKGEEQSTSLSLIQEQMPYIVPTEVKRFIVEYIDSIAELEAVLFLRDNRQQAWDRESVAARIYISKEDAGKLLAKLTARGFLVSEEAHPTLFRYQPQSTTLAEGLDRLAEVYSYYIVPVTNFIHGKSRRSIEGFADAFKFGKEE